MPENDTQQLSELLQIRRDKLTELQEAGQDPFVQTKYDRTHHSINIVENFDAFEGQNVRVAGRLMSKRGMGKVLFCDLADRDGKIQLFIKKDMLGDEEYAKVKKYDIGDIIGAEGEVFKTKTGEVSVKVKDVVLLSKSLLPLPEKFHGLTDQDLRYRQRYVDLIMNPEVKKTFVTRSKILSSIRTYLDSRGFLEVETPILNTIPAAARRAHLSRTITRSTWTCTCALQQSCTSSG